jgi:hypothetical protein
MKFDNGDWVRIKRRGVNLESLGAVVGKELYKGDAIYRVILLDQPTLEITCREDDLERWTDHLRTQNLPSICECGGDKLEIPHHYSWCPKG